MSKPSKILKRISSIFSKKKPNIVMILIDGARYDVVNKLQFYRELRKDSTFFSQLITYAPYTIASLHATFSGMYGNRNGVNGYYKSYSFDKKNCLTLAQYLKQNGYYTECDLIRGDTIPEQGFDKSRVHDEFNDDLVERHSEILTQIKTKQPFFLFLDYSKIHINLVTNVIKKYSDFDKEYFDNRENNLKTYMGWVEESGNYLKSILSKLKNLALWGNSIILVFNDHGSGVGDRIGEKVYGVYLYDYTVRCFLYAMGNIFQKGIEVKNLVRSIDIMPTTLDILKIREKDGFKKMQGASFLNFMSGTADDRIAYSETGGLGGPTPSPDKHNVKAVRTDKWKLIYNETNKNKELYNLESDREERNNLIGKHLEIENYLWEKLKSEQESNGKNKL